MTSLYRQMYCDDCHLTTQFTLEYKCRYYDMKDAPYFTSIEAAEILELDPRQVQRLAPTIEGAFRSGHGVRAPYLFPKQAILNLKAERDKKKKRADKPGGLTTR